MSMMNVSDAIVVTSIAFSEGSVEISYIEKREQQETVGMMRTLFIDIRGARVDKQIEEILELAIDVVDSGLIAMRNPEPSIDPRKRFRNRAPQPEEEDDQEDDLQGS